MKTSIRRRLLSTTLLIAGFSLLFSGLMIYALLQRELLNQAIDSDRDKLALLSSQLNVRLNAIDHMSKQIIIDPTVQEYMKQTGRARLRTTQELTVRLQSYLTLEEYLHSIVLLPKEGRNYWTRKPYDEFDAQYLQEDWYRTGRSLDTPPYFTRVHQVFAENTATGQAVISYVMSIRNLNRPLEGIGEVIINMHAAYFSDALFATESFDGISLLDTDGTLILGAEVDAAVFSQLNSGAYVKTGDKYFLSMALENNWLLLSHIQAERYRPHTDTMITYFLLFAALSLLLIFISIIPLQLSITRPLQTLSQAMNRVMEGDIEVNAEVHSGDEIETLSNAFNRMLSEIRFYIDTTISQEEEKRKLEMQLLLEQINPHFIYNTLNAIVYLARKHDDESIEKMTRAFIGLLRESVRLGEQSLFNTVEAEVDMIRLYLEIMRYRVEAPYEVQIDVDECVKAALIPRAILQPLIENALYHGLLPKSEVGRILVSIHREETGIVLGIQDDGVGMPPETLSRILLHVPDGDRMYKIGIYNVKSRLDLLYGDAYTLTVLSTPGLGTSIKIELPIT